MNNEQDYASDTDESDEDFRLDNLAGESAASEDDDSDENEGAEDAAEDPNGKLKKRRKVTKKSNKKKKLRSKDEGESEDELDNRKEENQQMSRRTTRQTEDLNTNLKGKNLEKDELESDEEDKSRTNALWADFLKDVKPENAATATIKQNKITTDEKTSSSSSYNGKNQTEKTLTLNQEIKAPTSTKSPKEEIKKTIVTEVVDFAGEELRIQREIDPSSIKENKAAVTQPRKLQPFGRIMPGAGGLKRLTSSGAAGSSAGVGFLLNQLGKKKKISVLEKSQMDWNSFKQDEGIDEQLQTFNKGKDGYLERQDFLQRTDIRQFEIEKSLRQSTRRPH